LLSIIPLFFIGNFNDHVVDVDYAAQRCLSSHCTCKVNFTRKPSPPEEIVKQISDSVFFKEDSSDVSDSYKKSIEKFLNLNKSVRDFTVVGYADGCGSYEYNRKLSSSRAVEVKKIIQRMRPGSRIKVLGMSELSNTHSDSAKRVDIVAGKKVILKKSFPNLAADVYLIDASGSMRGKIEMIKEAIAHSKPKHAKVFISYSDYCRNGEDLESITPSGSTEIWYSYWWVLDKMSTGQTLMIISDFDSRIPLTSRERAIIESKVSAKEIKVYAFTP
tara:strand:- start:469 stop:1290 length:822 start_codon:yes stop_codon:yes gene_type:complete